MTKTVLFEEINGLTLWWALFFKLRRYAVHYLALNRRYRKDPILRLLEAWGIYHLRYDVLAPKETYFNEVPVHCRRISEKFLLPNPIYRMLVTHFGMDERMQKKFQIALEQSLMQEMTILAKLLLFADHFRKQTQASVFLFAKQDLWNRSILEASEYRNIYPKSLYLLSQWIQRGSLLLPRVRAIMQRLWKVIPFKRGATSVSKTPSNPKPQPHPRVPPNPTDYSVLYFPHKGFLYRRQERTTELILGDPFYSEDPDSPFAPSRILHLLLGAGDPIVKETVHCFDELGIPHLDLHRLPYDNSWVSLKRFYRLLTQNRVSLLKEIREGGTTRLWFLFQTFHFLQQYRTTLSPFTNARFALIARDLLIPRILCVALGIQGIQLLSYQDRFIAAHMFYHLMSDYYFVTSEFIAEKLRTDGQYQYIGQSIPIGLIKTDPMYKAAQAPPIAKYEEIKKHHFLVLALDYHVPMTFVENYTSHYNFWKNLKRFYRDLICLASEFPEIYIVIKNVTDEICDHPEFADFMDLFERLPNIEFAREYVYNPPEQLAVLADAGIALYTSLADEMLAAGIPTIYYDFFGVPSTYFDYENNPMMVYSYEELILRMKQVLNKTYMKEEAFLQMRERFFGKYDGKVKDRLHQELLQLYHESEC